MLSKGERARKKRENQPYSLHQEEVILGTEKGTLKNQHWLRLVRKKKRRLIRRGRGGRSTATPWRVVAKKSWGLLYRGEEKEKGGKRKGAPLTLPKGRRDISREETVIKSDRHHLAKRKKIFLSEKKKTEKGRAPPPLKTVQN